MNRFINVETASMIMLGIFLGYFWHFYAVKNETEALQRQNKQYQIQYEDYIDSKEYKAIQTCKDSDFWKAECLAWEMNNDSNR